MSTFPLPCTSVGHMVGPMRFTVCTYSSLYNSRSAPAAMYHLCTHHHVSALITNITQRMHRLHPAPPIPRRNIQQHRPKLRQPRSRNLELRRNQRRHNLLLPPPPPAPRQQMPPRRLLLTPPQHPKHAARLPHHRHCTESADPQPQR